MNGFLNIAQFQNFSHKLNEIIKNPNAKLEEVLDEECLVNDFRDDKAAVTN